MGHIFYFIGLFIFLISLSKTFTYFKFIDIKEWVLAFKKVTQKDPEKSEYRSQSEYNLFISFGCITLFEGLWFLCGVLSSNWLVFISTIGISMVLSPIINKTPVPLQKVLGFSLSLFKSLIILLLVINHFHLHMDLIKLI